MSLLSTNESKLVTDALTSFILARMLIKADFLKAPRRCIDAAYQRLFRSHYSPSSCHLCVSAWTSLAIEHQGIRQWLAVYAVAYLLDAFFKE